MGSRTRTVGKMRTVSTACTGGVVRIVGTVRTTGTLRIVSTGRTDDPRWGGIRRLGPSGQLGGLWIDSSGGTHLRGFRKVEKQPGLQFLLRSTRALTTNMFERFLVDTTKGTVHGIHH